MLTYCRKTLARMHVESFHCLLGTGFLETAKQDDVAPGSVAFCFHVQ